MKRTRREPAPRDRESRLRRMLAAKREEILATLERQFGERLGEDVFAALDEQIEIGDRSVATLGKEVELGVLELKRRELRQIDEARARLDAGTYGICEDCGTEIDEKRLAVLPFATQCVDCKRRKETAEEGVGAVSRGFQTGFGDLRESWKEEEEE